MPLLVSMQKLVHQLLVACTYHALATTGVSYIEIAALRYLSTRTDFPYHIVIATTRIISGNTFLEALLPHSEHGLAKG